MTIIGNPSSFFDTLEADFAHHRASFVSPKRPREIYHRTMFSEHPTRRYWPQMLCSCVQKMPNPGQGHHQCDDTETPRKSSSYPDGTTRRRASLMKYSPEKLGKIDPEDGTKSCPPTLTTTIVESHEPDWLSEDDDSLDAILLDDDDAQENSEPKRLKSEEKFAAHLNLEYFQPAEIQVQVLEDPSRPSSKRILEVRARHQAGPHAEHDDLTGDEYECLEYVKRLSLPVGVAPDELHCRLDARSGHMIIDAPLGTAASEVQLLKHRRAIPIEIQDQAEPKPPQQQNLNSNLIVIE